MESVYNSIRDALLISLICGIFLAFAFLQTMVLLVEIGIILTAFLILSFLMKKEGLRFGLNNSIKTGAWSLVIAIPFIFWLSQVVRISGDEAILFLWIAYLALAIILGVISIITKVRTKSTSKKSKISSGFKREFASVLIISVMLLSLLHVFTFYSANECALLNRGESCYTKQSIIEEKVYCNLIDISSEERDMCYMTMAGILDQKELCNEVSSERKAECRDTFTASDSKKTGEFNCPLYELSVNRDRCYKESALVSGNASECLNISDETQKEYCISDVAEKNKDPKVCGMIDSEYGKNNCYRNIAIATHDSSYCAYIQDPRVRSGCVSNSEQN